MAVGNFWFVGVLVVLVVLLFSFAISTQIKKAVGNREESIYGLRHWFMGVLVVRPCCSPKASCAVVSDHDQIPVARFSPPARAGAAARKRLICRSDHRNASICSASVREERSVNISAEK